MNMVWFVSLFHLLLCLTAKCQESVELLTLHDSTLSLQPSSDNKLPAAVQVQAQRLNNVSSSVLMAETWLRNYVLPYYPSTNISTIVVGHNILCSKDQENKLGLVLPAIKNIHHSLTRWGLQQDIKVAAAFSSDCLDSTSESYRPDVAESYIKPLLTASQELGSPYVVSPPPHLRSLSDQTASVLLKSHLNSMKNLQVFNTDTTNVIFIISPRTEEPSKRKLSFIDISSRRVPYPPRPTPVIAPSRSPSGGASNPAYAAGSPLPPLVGTISPPPTSPSLPPEANPPFLPHVAPMANPASPPFGPRLPPCEPSHGGGAVGAPVAGTHHGLWCVAKPSVPAETLQGALDYACGEGSADCEAIKQDGSCYFPDSLVAHASYAFNSYWQKNKKNGGTCGFGGTAMLISSDPSYGHCRFILT